MLYARQDHLRDLRDYNGLDADLPECGRPDALDLQQSEYPFI